MKHWSFKHGMTNSSEYKAWNNMYSRCLNPNHPRYHDWGGRGITIDPSWLTFEGFYKDMGDKPSPRHTLERWNNSHGYSKRNCYWASTKEQALNRRSNKLIKFNGITQPMVCWAEELGINKVTLASRLRRGWTVDEAFAGVRNLAWAELERRRNGDSNSK